MLPLLTAGSPRNETVPLRVFAGAAADGANVTDCACEAADQLLPAFAASPSSFGRVQNCPLRWTTTTWYLPAGICGSGERSRPLSAIGSTRTSSVSLGKGAEPAGR